MDWGRGWFGDGPSVLHLLCTLLPLLGHQLHFRSLGIRSQRLGAPDIVYSGNIFSPGWIRIGWAQGGERWNVPKQGHWSKMMKSLPCEDWFFHNRVWEVHRGRLTRQGHDHMSPERKQPWKRHGGWMEYRDRSRKPSGRNPGKRTEAWTTKAVAGEWTGEGSGNAVETAERQLASSPALVSNGQ